MIFLYLLTMMNLVFADPTWKWANAVKIVEKHEFYTNNEIITRPKNSWQVLFAVVYHDSNLKTFKDCLFYKVPGDEAGILKLKTTTEDKKCEELLYAPGDEEWKGLKALQYAQQDKMLTLSLTNAQFEIERWDVIIFNSFEHPIPKPLLSSAEYRAPKVMFLTPYKGVAAIRPEKSSQMLSEKALCHSINEECQEVSASICSQCPNGWYEIPNGCPQGPKYCGVLRCGLKHQPACRRGIVYQRAEETYRCGSDESFAYCAKGLSVQCQNNLPYCL